MKVLQHLLTIALVIVTAVLIANREGETEALFFLCGGLAFEIIFLGMWLVIRDITKKKKEGN